jgi:hypothetical protein
VVRRDLRLGGDRDLQQHAVPDPVTNRGALTERWVVRFTNSTSFEVIGENVGVIATGNTSADCAPNNPATGVPYFPARAGLGQRLGHRQRAALQHHRRAVPGLGGAHRPAGPESVPDDNFTLLIRGDVDTP